MNYLEICNYRIIDIIWEYLLMNIGLEERKPAEKDFVETYSLLYEYIQMRIGIDVYCRFCFAECNDGHFIGKGWYCCFNDDCEEEMRRGIAMGRFQYAT